MRNPMRDLPLFYDYFVQSDFCYLYFFILIFTEQTSLLPEADVLSQQCPAQSASAQGLNYGDELQIMHPATPKNRLSSHSETGDRVLTPGELPHRSAYL